MCLSFSIGPSERTQWYGLHSNISIVLFRIACFCLLHNCRPILKSCSAYSPDIGSELDDKVLQLFERRYAEKLAELNLEVGWEGKNLYNCVPLCNLIIEHHIVCVESMYWVSSPSYNQTWPMIYSEQKTSRTAPKLYGFSALHRAGEQGTEGESHHKMNI